MRENFQFLVKFSAQERKEKQSITKYYKIFDPSFAVEHASKILVQVSVKTVDFPIIFVTDCT